MSYSDWSTTAGSNNTTLGIDISEGCAAANINNALREMMAQLASAQLQGFPAGTIMLFKQTAAPTGWTKITSTDDAGLRVVSGTVSSGGTVGFTTAFSSARALAGTSGSHVLTIAEMPAHQHGGGVGDTGDFAYTHGTQAATSTQNINTNSGAGSVEGLTDIIGGDGGHTHTLSSGTVNLAVKYADVIFASKS